MVGQGWWGSQHVSDGGSPVRLSKGECRELVGWALDSAERVFPLYVAKFPDSEHIRSAIDVTRNWTYGRASSADVRNNHATTLRAVSAAADEASAEFEGLAPHGCFSGGPRPWEAAKWAARAVSMAVGAEQQVVKAAVAANAAWVAVYTNSSPADADQQLRWQIQRLPELRRMPVWLAEWA